MRVLHVIPALASTYGGPSQAALETCRTLIEEGVEAEIATTDADAKNDLNIPLEKMVLYEGIPIYFFKRTFNTEYKFSWPITRWLAHHITDYDLLHIHSIFGYPATLAAYLARRYKVPYIMRPLGMLDYWSMDQNKLAKRLYFHFIEKANLNHARAIHYTSEEEKKASERFGFTSPGVVVPLGISINSKQGEIEKGLFKRKYSQCAGKKLIVFLSRIHPKKGLELLIEAISKLKEVREDFLLVIAGSGEPRYETMLRRKVEEKNLTPQILFTGFLEGEEKAALLNDADLFVLPSYQENFGLAVVEAMARGVPAIVSNRVNICREIQAYGAGKVVPCEASKIEEAIQTLLSDDRERRAMGERARCLTLEKFNSTEMGRNLAHLYHHLLDKKWQMEKI